MNKLIARSVAVAVMLALFSMPVTLSANADDDDQPHMQAALDALKQAEQHLKEAAHDKGAIVQQPSRLLRKPLSMSRWE